MTMTIEEWIRSFAALPPDWDSYGASPIAPDVIERALRLLPFITAAGLHVWAVPRSDGGIGFEGVGIHEGIDFTVDA